MKRLFTAAALACASPALAATPPIEITQTDPSIPEGEIREAVRVFLENCSPLNGYLADFQTIKVRTGREFADHRLSRGWKTDIHITLTVPDQPRYVPKFDPRTHLIAGHTLHYHIGGGSSPGILGSKRSSQMLCGLPIDQNGSDTFKSVPGLSLIRYQ